MPAARKQVVDRRELKDLRGIGRAMLADFEILGVRSVAQLRSERPQVLYERLCSLTGTRHDPCVLDTFRCAVEQAQNRNLPPEQTNWWYWSRLRKADLRSRAPRG